MSYSSKKISENPKIVSEIIFPKIKDKIIELSCDQFGNYFIQKVIEHLKIEEIKEIFYKKISNQFRLLSLNQHGTRVIQKIFERIINQEDLLNYYTLILTPYLKEFIFDANASHIIIKYTSLIQSPKNDFIIKFLSDNIFELATKKHSCCALQKCIEFSNSKQKKFLLNAIANKSFGLFTDQFGNYVVQFVVNICDFEINKIIVLNLLYDIPKFASQKFSSNVIEKCLDCCDEETKDLIVKKFCEQKLVQALLFDMYGNYVLQKTISISKEPYRSKFLNMVGPIMGNLKVLSFGQKLYNKLLSTFPELHNYVKDNNNKKKNKQINNNNYYNNIRMKNNYNIMNMNGMNNMNDINNLNIMNNMTSINNMNNMVFNNNNYQFYNYNQIQRNYPIMNSNLMNNFSNSMNFMPNIEKIQYFNNCNNNLMNNNYM